VLAAHAAMPNANRFQNGHKWSVCNYIRSKLPEPNIVARIHLMTSSSVMGLRDLRLKPLIRPQLFCKISKQKMHAA
jgi:hypothetical protein